MIGIQGQTFLIPAVANIPARDVPLIVMLILAVMTLLIGWKVLAGAAVLHVFSGLSGQGAAPGAGPVAGGPLDAHLGSGSRPSNAKLCEHRSRAPTDPRWPLKFDTGLSAQNRTPE